MKVIIFDTDYKKLISHNIKGTMKIATENEYWNRPNIKLKPIALIKAILFERGFLWKLEETIKYSLIHAETYRGRKASEVLMFQGTNNFLKIWKHEGVKK